MSSLRTSRRGSIYIAVLGSSALILAIALAAVMGMRISKRTAAEDADFSEARIYARSGIEIGMHYISTDPFWRTNRGNGAWATNIPIGRGSFSLSAADPVDNDVRNGENHPVILTATGTKGQAVCKMRVRMEVGVKTGSCLEVSLCTGLDCTVNGATLNSDQTVSTNRNFTAGGAVVNANAEAYNQFNGATYSGSKKLIPNKRVLPNPLHVFDAYVSAGTPISYTSLPQATQPELIVNGDFENNVSGWYVKSGAGGTGLTQDASVFAGGLFSMKVSGRKKVTDVAAQDVPIASFIQGHTYTLKMPIYTSAAVPIQASLELLNSTGTTFTYSTPAVTPVVGVWSNLQGTLTPTWTGTLTKATVQLTTTNASADYNMDKVSLKDTTFKSGAYYIDQKLLAPNTNPFGATNASGIYVVNCGGKDVIIGSARIVGTVVFKNPGGNTEIQGPVNWEPAIANYPALLIDGKIAISFDHTVLSEASIGVNCNPTGCPYPYAGGTVNNTSTDTYPSQISGIVYSAGDLNFSGAPTILGNITVTGRTLISATSLNLTYSNVFYNLPPPGFDVGRVPMNPIPGTWQRTAQ